MEEKPVYPETKLTFVERRHEFGDVYTYVFKSQEPVSYIAGQYGHVRVSGLPEGVRAVREFSFASAPHEEDILFGVDARSGSDYQKRLDALEMGDTVTLFKIKNHMTWPPEKGEAVMIAGGVGITPFRSMLRDREGKNLDLKTVVLHVARDGFLYESDMQKLADEYIQCGRDGFMKNLAEVVHRYPNAHYYVAGSPAFVETALKTLQEKGISAESDPFKGLDDI